MQDCIGVGEARHPADQRGLRICFVEASGQNAFFGELHSALRGALSSRGVATETAIDHFPPPAEGLVYLVVPHEYLALTLPGAHPTADQLRRTIVISTEQPGTTWFEEVAPIALQAGATLDINPLGVAELKRRGVRAQRLALGYVGDWDCWGGEDDAPRPMDVTFLGGYTERRGKALARCAQVLERRRIALHLRESLQPHAAGSTNFLVGRRKWEHLAASKILINIHRDEAAYFEWQRIVESIANGCVVVAERSLGSEPLVPGEHFVSTSCGSLPFVVEELLEDEERLREIQQHAYRYLRDQLPLDPAPLLEAANEIAEAPPPVGPRTASVPLPRRLPPPAPPWAALSHPTETRLANMALKRLVLNQRRLEQRLAKLERPKERLEPQVRRFGPRRASGPRVSVVVSLYNYEQFIAEALASVALSGFQDLEVVVVDDASTDGSHEAASEALADFDWLPARLVRLPLNEGLAAARNHGAKQARGELLFILDADNAVYPHAFSRLVAALNEDSDAAFAYGLLECFDGGGGIGLMNWLPWSKERLARGNYIDATALIRRQAFEQVGGYPRDERLYGWEDFALWCAFAQAGMYGVQVPEIVARYRVGRVSMIDFTNIDTSDAWSALLERYAFLTELDLETTDVR